MKEVGAELQQNVDLSLVKNYFKSIEYDSNGNIKYKFKFPESINFNFDSEKMDLYFYYHELSPHSNGDVTLTFILKKGVNIVGFNPYVINF